MNDIHHNATDKATQGPAKTDALPFADGPGLSTSPQNLEILEFNPNTHEYYLNGFRIPGVSEVMRFGNLSDASWYDNYSTWRGSAVHLACQLDDQNDLDPTSLDETIKPYLEGWRKFKSEIHFQPVDIEIMLHGNLAGMLFAGTPDRAGVFRDWKVVLDIKSGAVRPETAIQLAAYSHLTRCLHRMAVRLDDGGEYTVKIFPLAERLRDLNRFQGALANWWWKNGGVK